MKWITSIMLVGALLALGFQGQKPGRMPQGMPGMGMHEATAETYEHLATAIIALRETEDSLVKGIIDGSYMMAQHECQAALDSSGPDRARHLEAAAREITDMASEGDKRIQAIRQRLLKAGHHHHTDAETDEDYVYIDSKEKKQLLDLAMKVSRLGANATDDDIRSAMDSLKSTCDAAMKGM